jgi:hypothetical protein
MIPPGLDPRTLPITIGMLFLTDQILYLKNGIERHKKSHFNY